MALGLSFLGVFMMWLMWICVYMHQMNPLIHPILDKEIVENLKNTSKKDILIGGNIGKNKLTPNDLADRKSVV